MNFIKNLINKFKKTITINKVNYDDLVFNKQQVEDEFSSRHSKNLKTLNNKLDAAKIYKKYIIDELDGLITEENIKITTNNYNLYSIANPIVYICIDGTQFQVYSENNDSFSDSASNLNEYIFKLKNKLEG